MPDLKKSHDKMSENFSKMTPAMRRHLTMHLSYLQSDCKKDALDDPLFHLNVMALNEFYQLNAFLYPSDVRTILDSCGTDKIRRALILLGQCQKPHILRQVDIEALRTEMEQVTGCGPAKQTLLDLVSRTNRTAVPFRVLLVGPSGIGKTLLGDILAAHYKPRRIDCGSISSPVALAGEESGYNNSTYGMLADAALDQADLLQFTGVDRITFGGQNGNPFPALIQLVREYTVHDLYLGASVHVNANIIAEAESTASLPADLISAFDAVIAMPAPTREERLAFGKALFDTLNTRGGLVLEPDVLPWLLDHYCPDEGMTNLKTSVERLFHAASNAPDPALPITIPAAEKFLGAAQLSEYEKNVLAFRQGVYSDSMRKVGQALMQTINENRGSFSERSSTNRSDAMERFSYIARFQRSQLPFRFDLPSFECGVKQIIGLDNVKDTMRARLAGMEASNEAGRPLLFVGPAGTGKTHFCRVFAQSLNLPFEKISCAGLQPADLKGTSIVYNNSCAGVIAQALKRAGSTRAVLLLDEVDKLPTESQFALLDLLDGHRSFYEKHLDCDIDLHQLVPVLTANDLEKVSPILRDRCDLMPMYGYTLAEKKAIAQQAMLPAALKKYGLPDALFPENVTDLLVRRYCRAPGCRDMESALNRLCETLTLYRAQEKELTVNEALLETVLGAPPAALNHYPAHLPEDTTGLVSTLAVMRSSAGVSFGSRDAVQAVLTERPGITITGFAQDGLRESVQTALTAAEQLTGKTLPKGKGVHIHFCGDEPKDGTSGGCAIALALASLLTGTPVPRTFALTGTVDLLGSVGKVGGIPEKTEAALAADCKLLFLPGENRDDLPPELREQADAQGMEILFADTLTEIWAKCMELQTNLE